MGIAKIEFDPHYQQNSTRMKVTLVIYSLGGGGAERVMSILANYWIDYGWDVALILLVPPAEPSFYPLDPRIKVQSLGVSGNSENLLAALGNTWQRVKTLRRAIMARQPDVVISFMSSINVYTILACWKLNIPTIVSEHIYPTMTDANKIWQRVMKWAYRHADLLTVLTQNALPFYPAASGYRTIVMPNPVLPPSPKIGTERVLVSPSVIAIGRLHPQKGFDLLIKAFHRIQDQCPGWQLTILGEGPYAINYNSRPAFIYPDWSPIFQTICAKPTYLSCHLALKAFPWHCVRLWPMVYPYWRRIVLVVPVTSLKMG
jgi:GalNAc-alpha-(1->4)-GalNAc-alpha-(1->3)-diNAcBac-PP-undecaprenol alpha-1,4-N-acetyl-D-galactosaminyltransferase